MTELHSTMILMPFLREVLFLKPHYYAYEESIIGQNTLLTILCIHLNLRSSLVEVEFSTVADNTDHHKVSGKLPGTKRTKSRNFEIPS